MSVRVRRLLLLCMLGLSAASVPAGDAPPPASTESAPPPALDSRVATLMAGPPGAYPFLTLRTLVERFPKRLTGTPEAAQAAAWAAEEMRRIGLQDVHTEAWSLPRAWRRGQAQAQLEDGTVLTVSAYGWSGSTPGAVSGEVVAVDGEQLEAEAEAAARTGRWQGRILLITPAEPAHPLRQYAGLAVFARRAAAAGALAILCRDPRPGGQVHAEPLSFPIVDSPAAEAIAVLDISAAHYRRLSEALQAGPAVRLRLDVQNRFAVPETDPVNVVGDIPGTGSPDDLVILAAHLDAWDLGSGAVDDGFGVAAVLGAAQRLTASGIHPRRTLRVVLFSGEEQGLLGSRAYVEGHREALDRLLAAIALDWGSGPISRLPVAGHAELIPGLQQFARLADSEPPLSVADGYLFATDAYSFTLAGLPGIAPLQDSPDYSARGHSAADTLDAVDARVLARNSALLAGLALWLADGEAGPQGRLAPAETARRLGAKGQRDVLELLGLWSFGP